jgi:hypothetical protein
MNTIPPCVAENPAWRHAGSDSTITNSTTAKIRTKSRNKDIGPRPTIPPCVAENPAWRHASNAPTLTNATTVEERTESRDRNLSLRALSALHLVPIEFLLN